VRVPNRAEGRNGDEDQRRDGSGDETNFDERVAVAFFDDGGLIFVARTRAEFDDGIHEQTADQGEEDDDEPNRVHENIILHLGDWALGIQGRLAHRHLLPRATAQEEEAERGDEKGDPLEKTRKHG